jgi:carboxyl-terminal processing protease
MDKDIQYNFKNKELKLDKNNELRQNNTSMKKETKLSWKFLRNTLVIFAFAGLISFVSHRIGYYKINNVGGFWQKLSSGEIFQTERNVNVGVISNKSEIVDMDLFWQVWDLLERRYLFQDKIDYDTMIYGAISGMTDALDDPYTSFFPPKKNQISKENLNGAFFGVGIQLGYKKDQLAVMAPLTGMPAEAAGVEAGDYILRIVDEAKSIDEDTYEMTTMDAVELIRGEKGTSVKLTLLHDGGESPYEVEIIREEIVVPSVEVKFGIINNDEFEIVEDGDELVAHLRLSRFGDTTYEQWDEAVGRIENKGNKVIGVVLDLRNNPGGYMQGAIDFTGEFVEMGRVITKQEQTNINVQEFRTKRNGKLLKMPLLVMINGGSASASEIMAGALRDHSRAKIVGTTSFGKGTIQAVEDFDSGAGVHVTVAKWLTPNDYWVHEKGIEPDIEIKLDIERSDVDTQIIEAARIIIDGEY